LFTEKQFFRCLWQTLGLQLTGEPAQILSDKYDFKRDGRMNYKAFCEVIDKNFNPKDLAKDPRAQHVAAPEL